MKLLFSVYVYLKALTVLFICSHSQVFCFVLLVFSVFPFSLSLSHLCHFLPSVSITLLILFFCSLQFEVKLLS